MKCWEKSPNFVEHFFQDKQAFSQIITPVFSALSFLKFNEGERRHSRSLCSNRGTVEFYVVFQNIVTFLSAVDEV